MEELKVLGQFTLFGQTIRITDSLVIQWVIIAVAAIISIMLTRNLKKIPDKKQSALEIFVEGINNVVRDTMGESYKSFGPYIGSLIIFMLMMNLTGLIGFEPPTKDYSVALGMALTTFIVIQGYTIKKIGVKHYFLAYTSPFAALTPINILERVMLPVSLSLRLFGNMLSAAVIMGLAYKALGSAIKIPYLSWITQVGLPVPLHAYFDVFDGTVQMIIFTMLTMVNIKVIAEH